jgi:CheY-like chemotaxis protein
MSADTTDILVCEDNQVNQFMVTRFLEKNGYAFRVAANGREAVEAYKAKFPRLILMDVQMPVLDGLAATREIRELEGTSNTRSIIIAVTARAQAGDEEQCRDAGMDDYLSKPMRIQALADKLAQWLTAEAA